jgi:hypothetical protein
MCRGVNVPKIQADEQAEHELQAAFEAKLVAPSSTTDESLESLLSNEDLGCALPFDFDAPSWLLEDFNPCSSSLLSSNVMSPCLS